jgi:hypothetical protein
MLLSPCPTHPMREYCVNSLVHVSATAVAPVKVATLGPTVMAVLLLAVPIGPIASDDARPQDR